MLQKSKVTGKYYNVETLTLDEKIRLGFDKSAKKDLDKVPIVEKKSHVKKEKKETKKEEGGK